MNVVCCRTYGSANRRRRQNDKKLLRLMLVMSAQNQQRTQVNLFDHLIDTGKKVWRQGETESPSSPAVYDQLEPRRLHDRDIGGLLALQDAACFNACLVIRFRYAWPVAHRPPRQYELAPLVNRRNRKACCIRDYLCAPVVKEWISRDKKCFHSL